jgi:hypothetical protein
MAESTLATGGHVLEIPSDLMFERAGASADTALRGTFLILSTSNLREARKHLQRAELAERLSLAQMFAQSVYGMPGVREVRLTDVDEALVVTVLTGDRDMELDLALQRRFSELSRIPGSSIDWSLRVRPSTEGARPDEDGELIPR